MYVKKQTPKIAFVILAAGESKRMGRIKQLIEWRNKTFIEHIIEKSLASNASKTYVVLGANADEIAGSIKHYPVEIINNNRWRSGLGTSIAAAVKNIMEAPDSFNGILISLVDQPLIDTNHYDGLISKFNSTDKGIVATSSNALPGVPAIYSPSYFQQLSSLSENKGAKAIIRSNSEDVETIPADDTYIDLDTPEELEHFLNKHP